MTIKLLSHQTLRYLVFTAEVRRKSVCYCYMNAGVRCVQLYAPTAVLLCCLDFKNKRNATAEQKRLTPGIVPHFIVAGYIILHTAL